jgi:hypothetical protein
MSITKKLVLGSALVAVTLVAYASVKVSATRSNNFQWVSATAVIPLDDAGDVVIGWNETAKGKRWLAYSAECSASGGNTFSWIDIDVLVNGVAIPPTAGTTDGFCSPGNGYNRAAITMAIPVKAGFNDVQIIGRLDAGATAGWLGDTALVIN